MMYGVGKPYLQHTRLEGPCYLITDEHHETFKDFPREDAVEKYGRGRDPRCEDCMVHVGYEPSAVLARIAGSVTVGSCSNGS